MDTRRPGFLDKIHTFQETPLTKLLRGMKDFKPAFVVEKFCGDPDFVEVFMQAVTDPKEQEKFLSHSSKYANNEEGYDPHFVLFFRRTLPSSIPKHEERWTNEYIQVVNGLKTEIPEGPHRLHSIILCDSLEHLTVNGLKDSEADAFTDGEIVVDFPHYNQNSSICKIKPKTEKIALAAYLKTDGALSADELLTSVRDSKSR